MRIKLIFKIGRCIQGFHFAINHYADAVAIFCFIHVVRGYKYRNAISGSFIYQIPELPARNRVNTAGWFI